MCLTCWAISQKRKSKPRVKPFRVITGHPNQNQTIWFYGKNLQTKTKTAGLVLVQTKFGLVWNQTSPTLTCTSIALPVNYTCPCVLRIRDQARVRLWVFHFHLVPPLPSVNIFAFIYLPWHKLDSHHTYQTMTGRSKQTPQSSKTTDNHKCTQKAKTKCPAMDDSSREEFSLPVSSSRHSLSETNPHLEEWGHTAREQVAEDQAGMLQSQSQSQLHPPTSVDTIPLSFSRSQTAVRSESLQPGKGAKDVDYFFDREKGMRSTCQHCK